MLYLLLCILSSSAITVLFKYSERYNVRVFHMVVLNYFVAAFAGFFLNKESIDIGQIHAQPWLPMAVVIGVLFILMFFFIGKATREVGVAVTTVASKMSLVLPMLFSILYYNEAFGSVKLAGVALAVLAVVLTVYKKSKLGFNYRQLYFPVVLFLGAGIIDSLVKFAQQEFLDQHSSSYFSGVLFAIAGIAGVIASVVQREKISNYLETKTLLFGLSLGVVNFGSLYFMILALGSNVFDSSVVFGLNNVGVVLVSVFVAMLVFREKLSVVNWLGIAVSLLAIVSLASA